MGKMRKPFQGVWNIIRFNWQFYVLAFVSIFVLFLLRNYINVTLRAVFDILIIVILSSTFISLVVSWYIYDFSNLYKLSWLDRLTINGNEKIVNISAGFDETSTLLEHKFTHSELIVLDFYDAAKHTEVSIQRARRAFPPFPNTLQVETDHMPFPDNSFQKVFAILAAHEIRNADERNSFFKELRRINAAIDHENKEEIKWALAYCKNRLKLASLKQHINHWQALVDNLEAIVDKGLSEFKNKR